MTRHARKAALTAQVLRGLEFAVQFGLAVLAARSAGPSEYGVIGVLTSVQMLAMVLVVFGFDELTQREIARKVRPQEIVIGIALRARVKTCLAATGMGLVSAGLASWLLSVPVAESVLWMTGATVCVLASNFFVNIGLATYNVGIPLAASLLSWLIPFGGVAIFGVQTASEYFVLLFAGAAARLAMSVLWYWKSWRPLSELRAASAPSDGSRPAPAIWLLSTPQEHLSLTLNLLTTQVLGRYGDVLVAAALAVPLSAIAAYSLAFQITSTTNTFLMIGLGAVGLTQFSGASSDPTALGLRWRNFSKLAALISFGPFAFLAILAPVILPALFGSGYDEIGSLTLALLGAQWLNRVAGGGTNIGALIALGRSRSVATSSAVGALINVVGNFALIPYAGVYGMAIATAASVTTVGIWNGMTIRAQTRSSPPWGFLSMLTLGLLIAVLVSLLPLNLSMRIILSCAIGVPWLIVTIRAWMRKDTWA